MIRCALPLVACALLFACADAPDGEPEGSLPPDPVDVSQPDCVHFDADVDASVEPEPCAPQCPSGLQGAACVDGDHQCIVVEECGETIYCHADETVCDMSAYPGSSDPCPEGDDTCTDARYLNGMPVQCLSEACRDALEDLEDPDCPIGRACPDAEDCPELLAWCGQLWPGCELAD